MRLPTLLPVLLWASAVLAPLTALAQTPAAAPLASGIERSAIDSSVRPQDDFYAYANGRWLKHAVLPPDRATIGPTAELRDKTDAQLRTLIEATRQHPDDAEAAKLGDLYASFLDEASAERRGVLPLVTELAAIDTLRDRAALGALFARLGRLGVDTPMALAIAQDDRDATRYLPQLAQAGLGLPTRDYYLKLDDVKFRATRAKYLVYLARLFTRAGATPAASATSARAVLALETSIARVQWDPVENRDPVKSYNPVSFDDLPALAPALDWPGFVTAAGLAGKADTLLLRQPSYVRALGPLLASTPLASWQAYARARLLDAYAPYLGKAFAEARFGFAGVVLRGTRRESPRWKRGVGLVNEALPEALGRRYVAAHFSAQSRQRIEAMVENLLATCRERLATLDWMSPQTRQQALAKLARFNVKVGAPSRWVDYTGLVIRRDDLVGNVMRARRFEDARQLAKLGQPIDRAEWQMAPQTVNAYYDASMNDIVFPAAYLQPPNFDVNVDDAANYGAIGSTIGHEISHGFDDEGSQYDGDGNLHDWWTAADKARFKTRTAALVAQYSAFIALAPDYYVNGELTLGENIADNAGLEIAYAAWQRSLAGRPSPVIDGLTGDQRFFLAYAQSNRGKTRDAALLAQIKSDPHAPDDARVIGPLRNHAAFHRAFGVKPGDRMYLAPADRVSLW